MFIEIKPWINKVLIIKINAPGTTELVLGLRDKSPGTTEY